MSTIVLRCDLTWTTTNAGGYTKSTLPNAAGGSARTLDFPDPGLQAICENFRREFADRVLALDSSANTHVTISTATVT